MCSIVASIKRSLSHFFVIVPLFAAGCDSIEDRTASHYESGLALIERNEPEKAILEFRNALKLDDKHAASYFELGKIFEARGNISSAFARYSKAAELDPALFEASIKLARIYLYGQEFEKAESEIDSALELAPNNVAALAAKAQISLQIGDVASAQKAIDSALLIAPYDLEVLMADIGYVLHTASPGAALERADEALTVHLSSLELHFVKLKVLFEIGDQIRIGAQLTEMVDRFPDNLRFREIRLKWAVQNNERAVARAELRNLALAQPENLAWATNLIRLIRSEDGDKAAQAEFRNLIANVSEPFQLELLLAKYQVEMSRRDEAVEFLRSLVQRDDQNDEDTNTARIALARLLISEDRTDEAYALIDTVMKDDPSNTEGLLLRGTRLVETGEFDAAIQQIRLGLNEAPDDVRLLLLAAKAHDLAGNVDLANDRFAKAVRIDDYEVGTVEKYIRFLSRVERHTAVEIVLNEALQRSPDSSRLYDILGFTRIMLRNWSGAEEAAKALQAYNPERAQQLRAAIMIALERFDEGIDLLQQLPDNADRRAASISALIQTYLHAGRMEEAVIFLDDLLAKNPENLQALGLRGNIHLLSEEYAAASVKYEQILELDPKNRGAHSALARLYSIQGYDGDAEQQLLVGIERSPDDVILLSRLAELRQTQGDFDSAIHLYEQLYELLPGSVVIANNLASLLSDHRKDEPGALEQAYQIASRLRASDVPHYRDTVGWISYLRGDYEQALERIEPAARALSENPWIHYHLGMIFAALERDAEAIVSLQEALDRAGAAAFPPRGEIEAKLAKLALR